MLRHSEKFLLNSCFLRQDPELGPTTFFIDCLLSIYTTSASGIQGGNNRRERLDSDYQVPKEHPV